MSTQSTTMIQPEHLILSTTKDNAELARHYLTTASLAEALDKISFLGDGRFVSQTVKKEMEQREQAEKFFTELLTLLIGGKHEEKKTATGGSDAKKAPEAIFKMEAVLMALEEMMINNDQKKANDSTKLGDANTRQLAASYKKLLKEISQEQNQHESFWDKIADFFKACFEAIKAVFEGVGTEAAKACWSKVGQDLKKDWDAVKDLVMLVVHAVVSYYEAIAGGLVMLADKMGAHAQGLAKHLIQLSKDNGLDVLKNPAFAFVGTIVSLVIIAASVISGQLELAAVATVLLVLSATGALQGLTNDIAKGIASDLEKDGMSKKKAEKLAKIIADVVVVVAVAIAGAFAGGITSIETAATDATDSLEENSQELDEILDETTEDSQPTEKENESEKTKPSRTKRVIGAALAGGSYALGSVNLAADSINYAERNKKKKDETLMIIMEVLQEVIAAVGGLAGGGMVLSNASENSIVSRAVKKITSRFMTNLEENQGAIFNRVQKLYLASNIASGIASAGEGGEKIIQGEIAKAVAEIKSIITVLTNSSDLDTAQVKDDLREMKSQVKGMDRMVSSFAHLFDGYQAVANALAQA
ncbi:MAG: hypothetical protein KDK71_04560 [Chlamydiia bacterium]|nr:hypothetical protein [Chlamydiia bacterium]